MTHQPTLHPNLAKLAAAYDEIVERLGRHQITVAAARIEISQLEARDDQGVRWSIDPDSGEWTRKTATGDLEYDPNPPTYGYETPDAHTYTPNSKTFDPSTRLQTMAVDPTMELGPTNLMGATQRPSSGGARPGLPAVGAALARVGAAPLKVKAITGVALVAVLSFVMVGCTPKDSSPTPTPSSSTSVKAPAKKSAPHAPAKPAAKPATGH